MTPSEFALLTYLGFLGADREGVITTYEELSGILSLNRDTVARMMRAYKDADVLRYDMKPGQRKRMRVTFGDSLLVRPPIRPQTLNSVRSSEVSSDQTSDNGGDGVALKPALHPVNRESSTSDPTSDPRARTQIDKREERTEAVSTTQTFSNPQTVSNYQGALLELPIEKEVVVEKLMSAIGESGDEQTEAVVRSQAVRCTEAILNNVLEAVREYHPRTPANYVTSALKKEIEAMGAVA